LRIAESIRNPLSASAMTRIDALLLLMTLIWGTNYSIVKNAFAEIDPQAFNAVRMIIASAVFLAIIFGLQRARPRVFAAGADGVDSIASIFHTPAALTRRDWLGLAGLGIVGHFFYQYCFIGGLALTSVANSSLMLAATPVVIALLTALLGQDRIGPLHWAGAALSVAGIYVVVGHGMSLGGATWRGDLLMFVAVCCWAVYTLGARQLMIRHSPVGVTGLSMTIGTLLYVPVSFTHITGVHWAAVSAGTWFALVYSALFALCVAYTIWYAAVREIGSARTSVYSNLVPLVAMLTAIVFLGEPLSAAKLAGAAAVLVGVALTRAGGRRTSIPIPAEE
jgi:drug/metabolite transporter (DMT)-like permease